MWRFLQKLNSVCGSVSRASVRHGRPTQRFASSSSADAGVPYKTYESSGGSTLEEAPSSAEVVVVGGGVTGCSLLYHLTNAGITDVVLVEKDQLTAGTTWHTAGLVWSLRPSDLEVELLKRARDLMVRLESETTINPGWINNGGLFVASTKERLDEYKRLHTIGKAFGVESFVLDPSETKKLYPLMDVSDVYGTLYSPADGTIDPAGYCSALTRGATNKGAKLIQNCSVSGVQVKADDFGTKRVVAVETDRGTIQTKCVINAAGAWSPTLGAMAGVQVPLVAMKHAYVVTERIEGIQNMPNVRDHDASIYLKLQGDALSIGGYEPNPIFIEDLPKGFAFSLFDLDWDVFGFNIEGCMKRVPIIETTGVKSTVCGPESFTADHKPLMGESPEVRGFYLACGYNSSGMMLSATAGELVKWIINGRPDLDMSSYDIRRFTTKLTGNHTWCKERSHEAYAKNYSIVFPHDEPLASRNMRKDILHEVLSAAGCVFQERQGWERPAWFTADGPTPLLPYDYYGNYGLSKHLNYRYNKKLKCDYTFDLPLHHDQIGQECKGCREHVAVFNMSYFGKYYLIGQDSQKAADWIFTNDMTKKEGSTVYTCMLNKTGGIELDLTVSIVAGGKGKPHSPQFTGRGFYLAVGGGAAQHALSYVKDAIADHRWDCQILDHSEDMAMISVQGPQSRSVLQSLTDTDLSDSAFPFSTHQEITVAGQSCRALRLSFVGELGWELHVPNSGAVEVYNRVMAAGKDKGIVNAGYRAIDSLSLEKGYRLWHADIRPDNIPQEAGLGFTCKKDTDFLGKDAIQQRTSQGLKKKLVAFTIDEHEPLFGLEAIYRDEDIVGFLQRGDYAFSLGKSLGCGYVSPTDGSVVTKSWLSGGKWSIESMGRRMAATLHQRAPFDPENKRIRGIYEE